MRTMAIRIVFFFLWIAIAVKCKLTYIPLDCVRPVRACPINQASWTRRNDILECPAFLGYVCLRNFQGFLVETCMVNFTVEANTGKCPVLFDCVKGKPHLGPKSADYICPEEIEGCPQKHHGSYSIYKLYKYPRCLESNLTTSFGNMSENSTITAETSTTTAEPDRYEEQENIPIVIPILIAVILVTALIILSGCFLTRRIKRCVNSTAEETIHLQDIPFDEQLLLPEHTNQEQGLDVVQRPECCDIRSFILRKNTSEAKNIQIIPTEEDRTISFDKMYVSVSFVDDYKSHRDEEGEIKELALHEIFHAQKEEERNETIARYVFMLGDAGYGKTVQCKHITKSWCKAWEERCEVSDCKAQLNDLELILKEYHYLFFVQMRDVGDGYHDLIDIIKNVYSECNQSMDYPSAIEQILKGQENKCLILLDGLDEWNLNEKDKKLLTCGIPNCRNIMNSTVLITMRSWKFMEVKSKFQKENDRVVRLHGLDANGMKGLMTNMLCNYFRFDKNSYDFQSEYTKLDTVVGTASEQVRSMMKIPLLAVFCILGWKENMTSICSLSTLYLSIVEALIKRSLKKEQVQQIKGSAVHSSSSIIVKRYPYINNRITYLKRLGEWGLRNLISVDSVSQPSNEHVDNLTDEETLQHFLKIGILCKEQSHGTYYSNNIKYCFLHKTIQEFFASLYIFETDRAFQTYIENNIQTIGNAFDNSMILIFLSGLSPVNGCMISNHMVLLSNEDDEICRFRTYFASDSYRKVFWLYDLQLKCYREVNVSKTIEDDRDTCQNLTFVFSDIILHGRDTDRQTIRETASVLVEHASDIQSLQMKLIPDDINNGITNEELNTFLRSSAIKSLNIDGYIDENCRLFTDLSEYLSDLSTLGLHNVAFRGDNLSKFFGNEKVKGKIEALGIFYIGTEKDLKVPFRYQFSSKPNVPSERTGNERKYLMPRSPETSRENERIGYSLKDILDVLPTYEKLATFHVSYMHCPHDRQLLLTVIPRIKTLRHIGYQGSLVYHEEYDASVITTILNTESLRTVFLSDVVFNEHTFNFEKMSDLLEINLQDIDLSSISWEVFSRSIWKIPNKGNVKRTVFTDTNVSTEIKKRLQETYPSMKIFVDESSLS